MARAHGEWRRVVRECYHSADRNYSKVGGAGIRMYHPWRKSFENFLADMGQPPLNALLCRHDVTKDFTPDNCYWAAYG